jgi:2-oxoglutarate ferredoxin oxidoreductase subunit beta
MTYILKPQLHHPKLPTNSLGYTRRDYEGSVSTLCAGCGPTASRPRSSACFDWAAAPGGKLSGIGCSSRRRTTSGRSRLQHRARPHATVLAGANLANRDLLPGRQRRRRLASIGLGQFAHAIRAA